MDGCQGGRPSHQHCHAARLSEAPEDVGVEAAVKGIFFVVEANAPQLREISTLLEKGECTAVVDSAYSLQNYSEAWERLQGGHLTGKVVLTL